MTAIKIPSEIADITDLANRLSGYRQQQPGYYNPLFRSASMLEGVSGTWAVDANGGILSATPGSSAMGVIRLPQHIDVEKPFRVDWWGKYVRNPVTLRGIQLGLGDTSANYILSGTIECGLIITGATQANPCVLTTQYNHGLATGDSVTIAGATGMTSINGTWTVTRLSGSTFSIVLDTSASSAYTGNSARVDCGTLSGSTFGLIADAESFCYSISGVNGVITQSAFVLGTNPQSYSNVNPYKTWQAVSSLSNAVVNSRPIGAKLDRIYMRSWGGIIIYGVFVNGNGWDGPPDSRMPSRTVIVNPRLQDQSSPDRNIIVIPSRRSPEVEQQIMMMWHQNLGNESSFVNSSNANAQMDNGGATARKLTDNGYLLITSNGGPTILGSNTNNPANNTTFGFGNAWQVNQGRRALDLVQSYVTNCSRKVFHFGGSMGGLSSLNFVRNFPGMTKGIYLITAVTDPNESGLRGAPASLSGAIDTAYATYYTCIAAHTNQAVGDNTYWRPLTSPGGEIPAADRLPTQTTVTTGASSATQTLGSTAGMLAGQKLYFRILREWRTIVSVNSSIEVTLDLTIATTTDEPVCVECKGTSAQFRNRAIWSSATAYVIGDIVMVQSSNSGVDCQSNNPLRSPELYINIPIKHRYGNSGTTNDGVINIVQATAFATAVNALTGGNVTNVLANGQAHLSDGVFDGDDTVTFCNANKGK